MEQMRLARIALRSAFVEGNIRKRAISIIKTAVGGNLKVTIEEAYDYLTHIKNERDKAEEALVILSQWINRRNRKDINQSYLGRRDTAALLNVSIDTLRNWERNGLLDVPRNIKNGYRMYGQEEINRTKIIRTLRTANYSIMAILRMLKSIDNSGMDDVYDIVSTNQPDDDMVYATDRWIRSLAEIEKDANELIMQIKRMMKK
ncbi:MerR family transcriptional regulator [Chloroflexota bacterium]